jgi:hypothetical protein
VKKFSVENSVCVIFRGKRVEEEKMANPRKFSEKIALLNQKEAEGNAEFERIMREVSEVSSKVDNNDELTRHSLSKKQHI